MTPEQLEQLKAAQLNRWREWKDSVCDYSKVGFEISELLIDTDDLIAEVERLRALAGELADPTREQL